MNVQPTIEAINALPDDPTMWLDYTKDGTSTGEFMDSRHLKALVAANDLLQRKLDRAMGCVEHYRSKRNWEFSVPEVADYDLYSPEDYMLTHGFEVAERVIKEIEEMV